MSDTLADMMNGLTAIQAGASADQVAPPRPVRDPRLTRGPIETILGDRTQRLLAPTLPEAAGAIASAPTGLYHLLSTGTNWVGRKLGFEDARLPGHEGSLEITKAIQDPIRAFSNRLAGEELEDSLINYKDPAQMAAAWARLGTSVMATAPAAILTGITQGAQKLRTGIQAIDATGTAALKTMEVLSPVLMRPVTPGIAAANVAVPAALSIGLELAYPEADKVKKNLDQEAQRATDQAISGVEQSAEAAQVSKPQFAGFPTLIEGTWADDALVGLLSAGALASHHRQVLGRITDSIAQKTGLKRPMAGMSDPADQTTMTATQGMRSNIVDQSDPMKVLYGRVLEEVKHPQAASLADRFSNRIDASHGAAIDTKAQLLHEFGEIPGSTIKNIPANDIAAKVRKVDPTRMQILVEGMQARTESLYRQRLAQKNLNIGTAGVYGTPASEAAYLQGLRTGMNESRRTTYNFYDPATDTTIPYTELQRRWRAVQADPELRSIASDISQFNKTMLKYAEERGAITRKELNDRLQNNPDFYPTKLSPGFSHLSEVDLKVKGGLKEPGNPIEEFPRFAEKVMRAVEWNKTKSLFMGAMEDAARSGRSPTARAFLGRSGTGGAHSSKNYVHWRDRNGLSRSREVNDALVRRALQYGDDISRLHALSGAWSTITRFFESSATGALATVLLQPFAHTAALYAAGLGTVMRPKGIAAGPIDLAVQKMSGGRFGVRGDITNLAVAAPMAARGISAILAQRAASALHTSVVTNGLIARTLTPQSANQLATGLTNHYKRSWIHAFQQEGLLGPAIVQGFNPDRMLKTAQTRMLSGNVPLNVIRDGTRFINDILHAVSSSPTAAVWALNKGKNKDLVSKAIREFTGDPSKAGAFQGRVGKGLGVATTLTPWGNIFIQSTDRFLRELSRHPVETLTGLTIAYGLTTISTTLHNQSLGPEYSDYQFNKRTPDRQATSIYVGLPGLPPENGLEIPVDPLGRAYKVAVEMMVGSTIGAMDGTLFKPENAEARQSLSSMVRSRWNEFGEGSVWKSIAEQSVLPPVSPMISVPAAVMGTRMQSYMDWSRIRSEAGQAGFTEATGRDPLRGELWGLHESANWEATARALGANAGYIAFSMFMDSKKRAGEGQSLDQISKNAAQTLGQGARDSFRPISGLMDGFAAITPTQDSAATLAKAKVDVLKQLVSAHNATTVGGASSAGAIGTKTRGLQPTLGGSITVDPADPRMAALGQLASQYYQLLNRQFLGHEKDLYAQRQSIQVSTSDSPAMKRAKMNVISNQIVESNRAKLQYLQQFEEGASRILGVKVRLDKIKLGGELGQ